MNLEQTTAKIVELCDQFPTVSFERKLRSAIRIAWTAGRAHGADEIKRVLNDSREPDTTKV